MQKLLLLHKSILISTFPSWICKISIMLKNKKRSSIRFIKRSQKLDFLLLEIQALTEKFLKKRTLKLRHFFKETLSTKLKVFFLLSMVKEDLSLERQPKV